jgi:pimeloyl-ACP methyl ester carboxylesterase
MRDAIPGARLEVIRGAGHLPNLERPNEFNEIVRNFCLSLSAR